MPSENEEQRLATEMVVTIDKILGILSSKAKPWREISTEEMKMVDSYIKLSKKLRQFIEKQANNAK